MKLVTIIGARPQFIKAAALSRAFRQQHSEYLLHTGQHYDRRMSEIFFEELGLPQPDENLGVGSGPHGAQTAAMLVGIEATLKRQNPDWVVVLGDTNSTLAGALAAAKLRIPVAHVEAGLRSFNRAMPEETNRVLTDHLSALLLCPSRQAVDNLKREGITRGVHLVGDVMCETLLGAAESKSHILERLDLAPKRYLLATLHRAENTDDPSRLSAILSALATLAAREPIVFPLHPRTRAALRRSGLSLRVPGVRWIEPLGYLEMARLQREARMLLTDSGGMQKEAYWLRVPCITLRDQTEWVETVQTGWNVLAGANPRTILAAVQKWRRPAGHPALYGDRRVAARCARLLARTSSK